MMGGQKLRLRTQYTPSIGAELYYRIDAYLLLFLELMYSLTRGGNTSTVGAKIMSLSLFPVYRRSACSDCGELVKALLRATALPQSSVFFLGLKFLT